MQIIKYKIYFIVALIALILFSSIEYYKVSNTPIKHVIVSEVFLGTINFTLPKDKKNQKYILVHHEILKKSIYKKYFPGINLIFNLRDVNYPIIKLVCSNDNTENLQNTINDIFQLINNYALKELTRLQKYNITSVKLPYIINTQIQEVKYSFNIYFILAAILLSLIAVYITQLIQRLILRLFNDPK